MVECLRPEQGITIADPSCGTGGFFLAAYDFLTNPENYQLDKDQKEFLKHSTFFSNEIVANTRRPCLMNMLEVWFYDYRTNILHTLRKKPVRYEDLTDFIKCYNPENLGRRFETWHPETNPGGRGRKYGYEELIGRDKTSLDIFWIKDKSLTDLDNLPEPDELAEEIIENLEAGLSSFREVLSGLSKA